VLPEFLRISNTDPKFEQGAGSVNGLPATSPVKKQHQAATRRGPEEQSKCATHFQTQQKNTKLPKKESKWRRY